MSDLHHAFRARDEARRWSAERENATARLELARIDERLHLLLSRYEPVNAMGLDRELLRQLLKHVRHGWPLPVPLSAGQGKG